MGCSKLTTNQFVAKPCPTNISQHKHKTPKGKTEKAKHKWKRLSCHGQPF
jgi:hypothetical protein